MSDLWERLQRTRASSGTERALPASPDAASEPAPAGWNWISRLVARRVIQFPLDPDFAQAVVPNLGAWNGTLCFDVEATGLSGTAGTVAFLIGWADLVSDAEPAARVTQYFLRDHPGEADLIAAVDAELRHARQLVSFNGASYDLPLLRSRWALAGREFPEVAHRDDLHPARRLWKRLLESCRLSMLEQSVLGIERQDDVAGGLVPELWYSYLRAGTSPRFDEPLDGVLRHHAQDVYSLLCLDLLLAAVKLDPENARWQPTFGPFPRRENHRRDAGHGLLHPDLGDSTPVDFWGLTDAMDDGTQERTLQDEFGDSGSEAVGLAWARRLKARRDPRARDVWTTLWTRRRSFPALLELLKWLEHRERTPEARQEALVHIDDAFRSAFLPRVWRDDLERRQQRLSR